MRCACGYDRSLHDGATGRCPLCACGALPAEHIAVASEVELKLTHNVCPGKPRTAAGHLPVLRRGSFREPAPAPRYERRPAWGDILFAVIDDDGDEQAEQTGPPRVPARDTYSLNEIAPRARPLGTAAADTGWTVRPMYWQAYDGTETSALVMHRGPLRAVAYWNREPGASWKTGGAHAWHVGTWPTSVGPTRLGKLLAEVADLA